MRKLLELYKRLEAIFKKNKAAVKTSMLLILTLSFILCMLMSGYAENVNKDISQRLIRLHVVANSDSEDDQNLKRAVRDKILQFIKPRFDGITKRSQALKILSGELSDIENIADGVIKEWGKGYKAKAAIGEFPFPTKTYGDVALPAGIYDALRVELGKGDGANWWCVMFPPLCFVDATHGTITPDVKQKLKDALSEDEYALVTSGDQPAIKYKFKIIEILQGSKNKIAGLFSNLFKKG